MNKKEGQGTPQMSRKVLLSIDESALMLSISRSTVLRMIKRNDLQTVKIGSRNLVTMVSLTQLAEVSL